MCCCSRPANTALPLDISQICSALYIWTHFYIHFFHFWTFFHCTFTGLPLCTFTCSNCKHFLHLHVHIANTGLPLDISQVCSAFTFEHVIHIWRRKTSLHNAHLHTANTGPATWYFSNLYGIVHLNTFKLLKFFSMHIYIYWPATLYIYTLHMFILQTLDCHLIFLKSELYIVQFRFWLSHPTVAHQSLYIWTCEYVLHTHNALLVIR